MDPFQPALKAAAVSGIFMIWAKFTISSFPGTSSQLRQKKKLTSPSQESCVQNVSIFSLVTQKMSHSHALVAKAIIQTFEKIIFQYIMSVRSICHQLFEAFLIGGAGAVVGFTTAYLTDKIDQHDDEIEELFSRLEECEKNHESSQDHEFKK